MATIGRNLTCSKEELYWEAMSHKCVVCNKPRADAYWPDRTPRALHGPCYTQISLADRELVNGINTVFKNHSTSTTADKLCAHAKALDAIKEKCHPLSLAEYRSKYGLSALNHLFATVGLEAAMKYASSIESQPTAGL